MKCPICAGTNKPSLFIDGLCDTHLQILNIRISKTKDLYLRIEKLSKHIVKAYKIVVNLNNKLIKLTNEEEIEKLKILINELMLQANELHKQNEILTNKYKESLTLIGISD